VSPEHKPPLLDAGALVAALERAWDEIRAHHPEVPPVVLVFGTGSTRRATRRTLAHFGPSWWWPVHDGEPVEPVEPQAPPETIDDDYFMAQLAASAERFLRSAQLLSWQAAASLSEVLITDDGLSRSVTDVMGTLVHEAAHAIAFQRGIKDASRQGRYHNRRFKAIAEEIGLDVSRDPDWGWAATALSDPTAAAYSNTITQLARALPAAGQHEPKWISPELRPRRDRIAWCVSVARGIGLAAPFLPSAVPSAAYVAAVSWRSGPDRSRASRNGEISANLSSPLGRDRRRVAVRRSAYSPAASSSCSSGGM
jgi:hypothetical protein